MKIAFCVPSLGLEEGQGRLNLVLLRALADGVNRIDVVTSLAPPEVDALPGVRVRKIPRLPTWQLGNMLIMLAWTTLLVRRSRYDVIHADAGMRAGGGDTMTVHTISARWFDLPREIWDESGIRGTHARLAGRFKAWLEIRQFRRARILLANSDATARDLVARAVPQERIVVVPFTVDPVRFRPPEPGERGAARTALGIPEDAFVVAFVGAHGPRKGLPVLLEALAGTGAHLIAAGDHRGAGTIAHAARLGVALTAPGKLADVRTALWAADVLVYPSRYDALGLAALEAMGCGLPVVISPHAGAAEIVGDAGVVLNEVSAAAIASAVASLRADPHGRARLGEAARQRITSRDPDIPGQIMVASVGSVRR